MNAINLYKTSSQQVNKRQLTINIKNYSYENKKRYFSMPRHADNG